MIFGKTKLEFKVGLFVIAGLVLLAIFLMLIGKIHTTAAGYKVSILFNFGNGVKSGAPVRFAGVDIGVVKEVDLYYSSQESKSKVRVTCWLRKDIKIPTGSTVWVNSLGLLGEQYIEIMPGKDYSNCLAEGEEIRGEDPVPMHEIGLLAKNIAVSLNEGVKRIEDKEGTIGKLLYDDTIYNDLSAMVKDLRQNPWKLFWKGKGR
jgi:phospholipid/cholesterol/gamma-HCH transport system substrate-binding protein